VRQQAVRDGQMRIDTLGRIWPPADWSSRAAVPDEAWVAAGRALAGDGWLGGWRLNGPARIRLSSDGTDRTVEIDAAGGDSAAPEVVLVRGTDGEIAQVDVAGRSVPIRLAPAPDVDRAARAATAHHGGGPAEILAPMPGAILAVHATAGGIVGAGDPVVTLEAMKMEHAVVAPADGRVTELHVEAGDQVTRGQVLGVVEP